jgi:hypothetical protein
LIGHTVTNDKNETIGTINDLIMGQKDVMFAVLEVGGFLCIGAIVTERELSRGREEVGMFSPGDVPLGSRRTAHAQGRTACRDVFHRR